MLNATPPVGTDRPVENPESTASMLSDLRGRRSNRKPAQSASEDADEAQGDADEGIVGEEDDVLLKRTRTLLGPRKLSRRGQRHKRREPWVAGIFDAAEREGALDLMIVRLPPGGHRDVEVPGAGVQTLRLAAETNWKVYVFRPTRVIVLRDDLSADAAEAAILDYIGDELDRIAEARGQGDVLPAYAEHLRDIGVPPHVLARMDLSRLAD